jgi:hypothetical protein
LESEQLKLIESKNKNGRYQGLWDGVRMVEMLVKGYKTSVRMSKYRDLSYNMVTIVNNKKCIVFLEITKTVDFKYSPQK